MGRRHPNPRRAKIHRTYTVEELADLFQLHKNTIRRWRANGLEPIDNRRPALFRGMDVVAFLYAQRKVTRRSCSPGEIYCLKCRAPKEPDGGMVDLELRGPANGVLVGICPVCTTLLYRRVNPNRIDAIRGKLEVTVRIPTPHIEDRIKPIVNCDSQAQGDP